MSFNPLISRQRAQSTVSLRKRIVRQASQDKNNQMKKSSTMSSFRPKLQRLLQQGKIQQIMNSDPSSKGNLFYTNHVNQMQRQLTSTKKSLSTLVIKSRNKQFSINNLKNDIKKVERQIQIIRQEANLASKKYTETNDYLVNKKTQKETIYWDEKMHSAINDRGYKDEVFLKARYQLLQKQCDIQQQNHVLLENKYHQLKKFNKQLQHMRAQAQRISKIQANQKSQYIQILEADMSERELLGQLKADKHKREGHINEIASALIQRQELQKILEVLYSQRLLSQILRTKSNNLIQKYQQINKAYNHIKSNANIVEPQKILKRMEQHDKLYDDAIKRVNNLQAQVNNLENHLQNCMINKNTILSKQGHTESFPQGYYQGIEKDKYELLLSEKFKLMERNTFDEVLNKNIVNWGIRMFARYGINQSQNNNFLDCFTDLVVRIRQQK